MNTLLTYGEIDKDQWTELIENSSTATWFQTEEAYRFYESLPELFQPFVVAVERVRGLEVRGLAGICVGYVTKEKSAVKQFFTRRAIIIGGPALAKDCSADEVEALMRAVRSQLDIGYWTLDILNAPIYIETRNLNDYSRWKDAFAKAGFMYEPHLNFHVHTDQAWETIEAAIGKHRQKYIRLSLRDGATIEKNPTIEQVRAYYEILKELYKTKVKMPLQAWSFFENLYHCEHCKYLLVTYNGQVVGGSVCMVLTGKGVYEWYACGKDGEYKNIYPSTVAKYAGMKYACENGYAVFDMMGAGKPDEEYGVRDFKAEFGGEMVEHGRFLYVCKPILYRFGKLGVKLLKKANN